MPFGQFEALKPDLEMMPGMKSWRDKQHQEVPLTESSTRRLMSVFREASTSPTEKLLRQGQPAVAKRTTQSGDPPGPI